jgi:uncharacterized membrane protein
MQYRRTAVRVLLFALFGLLIEVFYTATASLVRGHWDMRGGTSPWMMLDYGLLGLAVGPLSGALCAKRIPLALRAVVYMLGIFLVEYVSGVLFTAFGLHIWDYSDLPLNLQGQITAMFIPLWYALGLFVEYLYRRVDACAVVLVRGIGVADLEGIPAK